MTHEAAADPADDLASCLFALSVEGRSTRAITVAITREIVLWAMSHGWSPRTEARVDTVVYGQAARLGFMDVIVHRGPGLPDLAIEIDSADKPWSVDKLRHAAAAGMHAIWVRWGDDEWAGVYMDVDVIQLPVLRRAGHRRSNQSQLVLW